MGSPAAAVSDRGVQPDGQPLRGRLPGGIVDKSLFTSTSHDWNTPEDILDLVRAVGPIGLDPCSNDRSTVNAGLAWDKGHDGLKRPWSGRGLVFVNPPYGKEIGGWMAKCCEEAAHGIEIVALVPARTDARWFQDYGFTAQRICFWRGRICFVGGASSAPFPSAVLYWGANAPRFSMVFGSRGTILAAGRPQQ